MLSSNKTLSIECCSGTSVNSVSCFTVISTQLVLHGRCLVYNHYYLILYISFNVTCAFVIRLLKYLLTYSMPTRLVLGWVTMSGVQLLVPENLSQYIISYSTQPGHPSMGRRNEYQPKGVDAPSL